MSQISLTSTAGDPMNVVLKIRKNVQPTLDDFRYIAERQKSRIVARTGRGLDFENRAFRAYSDAYAKRKAKTGRNSGVVDLNWSGRMLKALVTRLLSDGFTCGIYGEEGIRAAAHNAGEGHMPQRRFVAVSSADEKLMAQDLHARINARLQGTTLNAA